EAEAAQAKRQKRASEVRVSLRGLSDSDLRSRVEALEEEVRAADRRERQRDPRSRKMTMDHLQQAYSEALAEFQKRGLQRDMHPRCPRGHALEPKHTPQVGATCSRCSLAVSFSDSMMHSCHKCGYDLCTTCASIAGGGPTGATAVAAAAVVAAAAARRMAIAPSAP
ncbi:unnamed protein product, partial [Prorocentrum cordatum]